jgi:hypothetical protein
MVRLAYLKFAAVKAAPAPMPTGREGVDGD